jgi:hypothetical protein
VSVAPGTDPSARTPGGAHVRAALRRALRLLAVFLVGLAVLGGGLGWLVAGTSGVWGALIGVGVTLLVCGTTVATMLATADAPVSTTAAVVLGSWLAKMVVVVGVLVALNGRDLVDRTTLGVVVLVGVLGSAYLDYLAVSAARVPYVVPASSTAADTAAPPLARTSQDGSDGPRPDGPGTEDPGVQRAE